MRGKTREDFELLELIDPVAEAEGYQIVRLRLLAGDRTRRLQILAERGDGTMPVAACAALARTISRLLDAADPIVGGYQLEVSSPGIDRPLTRRKDFETWAGLEARIELDAPIAGQRRFRGVLAGLEGEEVLLAAGAEGETQRLPLAAISEAKLVLSDTLLARGAAARARRLEGDSSPDL